MKVLVPSEVGEQALGAVPGVTPLRYAPGEPMPAGAEDAEAIVLAFGAVDALAPVLETLPRLRLAQTLSAGTESWEGRLPAGVAISNARGAHGRSSAEWAMAALLSIHRGMPRFALQQREAEWQPHRGETLDGRRVLVLGAGDLARHLRAMLEPFGARATLTGRTAREGVHAAAEVADLLGSHDAVVVMLPLTPRTRGLVDAAFLARMPDGAVLVNVARGPVVDTAALLAEVESGRLRAALDVTDPEPLPADHPLWRAPGVLITPHVAGFTEGLQERAWEVVARQIGMFAAGGMPENLVG